MFLYALTIIIFAALTSSEIIEADRSINKTKSSSAVDSIFMPEEFSSQTKLTDSEAKQILETHIYSLGYTILDNQLVKRSTRSKEDLRIKNLVDQYRNSTIELFKSKKEKILKNFQEGPANYLEDNQRNKDFFNYMQFTVLDTQPYYLSSNLTNNKEILKSLGDYHQQLNNYSYSDIKFYSKDYELLLDDNIRDSEMNRDYYDDDLPTEKKDEDSGMKEIYADNDQSHSENDKKRSMFMKIYLSNATHLRPDMVTFPSFCVFNHLVVGMVLLVFSFIGMRLYHDNHPILLEGSEFASEERKFANVQSNKPKIVAGSRKYDYDQHKHQIRNESKTNQIPVTAKNSKTNSKISSTAASSSKKNKNSNNKFTEKIDSKTKTLNWLSRHKLSSSKDIFKTTQSLSLTKIFDIKNSKKSESKGKEIPLRFTKSLSGTKVSHHYVEDIADYCYEIGPQSLEIPENMSFTELHNSRRTSALSSQKSNTNTTKNNIQLINLVKEKQEQTLKENYTIDSSENKIEKTEKAECQCSGFDMGDHDCNHDGKNNSSSKLLGKTLMRNGKSQNEKKKMPQTTSSCDYLPSNNERDESVKNGPYLADSASKII